MKNILVIESSPRGEASFSRKLTHAIVEKLQAKDATAKITSVDLSKNPIPHLDESHLAGFFAPPENRTDANKTAIRHSETSLAQVMAADTIVIGVPMYNFSIPSTLKSWIDHIARAGQTFQYTPTGPEGLVKGKKVYLAIATGGVYSSGPYKTNDFTENYLRAVLGFMGMTDLTAFRVEGLAVPDQKDAALAKAIESIRV